jgi:hypothetical protein
VVDSADEEDGARDSSTGRERDDLGSSSRDYEGFAGGWGWDGQNIGGSVPGFDPTDEAARQLDLERAARDVQRVRDAGNDGLESSWFDPGMRHGGNFRFMDDPLGFVGDKFRNAALNPISTVVDFGIGMMPGLGQVSTLNSLSGLVGIGTLGSLAQNTINPGPNQLGPGYSTQVAQAGKPATIAGMEPTTPDTFDPGYPTIEQNADPFLKEATQQSFASLNPTGPAPSLGLPTKDWGMLTFDPASNQYRYPGA